ncbi:hypothetical protein [Luteibacter sp. 9135]|nr:hypothetical protein [Luteibacter sp. 9135]
MPEVENVTYGLVFQAVILSFEGIALQISDGMDALYHDRFVGRFVK